VRRIGAYGICRRDDGRLLLARTGGSWHLPGGEVRHGEHPADAAVRAVAERTGLATAYRRAHAAVSDVEDGVHTDRVLLDLAVTGGDIYHAEWVAADGLPVPTEALPPQAPRGPGEPPRFQRFGAYARVGDPAGRILLTQIAEGYPGAGRWHLPGGGTDAGEQPTEGLLRELAEEAGQRGRVTGLLGVSSAHDPTALGPEGYPVDWHVVRVHYDVLVDEPVPAVVTEEAGGSTARAAWFEPADLHDLRLTEIAVTVLGDGR
jgi:8-oxo-dGTP diphosphatase